MARYCIRLTLPIVETENPEKLADKINETLQEIVEGCPGMGVQIYEYNPALFE